MKSKTNVNIHNRFDIEVIRDGKIIQRGKAENIVLNRIYDRLCNYQSYFSNIVYGSSNTGDLDPERETLFARIGSAAATTVETIKAYPVSKWTRKITLGLTTSNNQWIREVGISDEGTKVNTHALLTKLDDTPLELYKTELDIITIYATVFIELANKDANNFFVSLPNSNVLLNYLVGGNAPAPNIITDRSESYKNLMFQLSSKTPLKDVDILNRKIIYTRNYSTTVSNGPVRALVLDNIYKTNLFASGVCSQYNIVDSVLDKGDGIKNAFLLKTPEAVSNLTVKIDDVVVDNQSYDVAVIETNDRNFYISLLEYVNESSLGETKIPGFDNTNIGEATKIFHLKNSLVDKTFVIWAGFLSYDLEGTGSYCKVYIYGSNDGENFALLVTGKGQTKAGTYTFYNLKTHYDYIKIKVTKHSSYGGIARVCLYGDITQISFNSPPGLVEDEELGSSDGIEDTFELVHSPIITVEGDPETDPPIPNEYALTIKFDDVEIDQSEYTIDENEIVFNIPPGLVYSEMLGEGDGEEDTFTFRFTPDAVTAVYIDGEPVDSSDYQVSGNEITFNAPPLQDEVISADYEYSCDITADYRYEVEITASYTVPYIPKSVQNVLDVSMEITFGPQEEEEEEEE